MSAGTWDEVRALMAQLEDAQQRDSLQRLSERNCIEIVQKLCQLKLIELLHSSDGRHYITPDHVITEIRSSLFDAGGRINVVELQQRIGIDLSIIESKVNELCRADPSMQLIVGQLIHSDYIDKLVSDINSRLKERGSIELIELLRLFDLPVAFLEDVVRTHIGGKIEGLLLEDSCDQIYTHRCLARIRAQIRGVFRAVVAPTTLGRLMGQVLQCNTKQFFAVLSTMQSSLNGHFHQGSLRSQDKTALFIPSVYVQAQRQWASNFLQTNGYLDFASLSRIGIHDAEEFIAQNISRTAQAGHTVGGHCYLTSEILLRMRDYVDEQLHSDGCCDLAAVAPPCLPLNDLVHYISDSLSMGRVLTEEQLEDLDTVETVLGDNADRVFLLAKSGYLVVSSVVSRALSLFDDKVLQKADMNYYRKAAEPSHVEAVEAISASPSASNSRAEETSKQSKKEQRRKKAAGQMATSQGSSGSGRSGGAGRESRTKAVKNKYNPSGSAGKKQAASTATADDDNAAVDYCFSIAELTGAIRAAETPDLELFSDEAINELAELLWQPLLQRKFDAALKSIFLQRAATAATQQRQRAIRKTNEDDLQSSLSFGVEMLQMYCKGAKHVAQMLRQLNAATAESVGTQLNKHLLRTIANEYIVSVTLFDLLRGSDKLNKWREKFPSAADIYRTSCNEVKVAFAQSSNAKLLADMIDLDGPLREAVINLCRNVHSGGSADLDAFLELCRKLGSTDLIGFCFRKADKKRDRQTYQDELSRLSSTLAETTDLPSALPLACSLVYCRAQPMSSLLLLTIPGKCVADMVALIGQLEPSDEALLTVLQRSQELAVRALQRTPTARPTDQQLEQQLDQLKTALLNT